MNKIEILVTGGKALTTKDVIDLLNENEDWAATEALTGEEAIEKFHRQNYDIVVFTNGNSKEEERKLRRVFTLQNPDIIILEHYSLDGNSLSDEIKSAFVKQQQDKKFSFTVVDDALKNAGLNITIQ